jgi:hypothetical protein
MHHPLVINKFVSQHGIINVNIIKTNLLNIKTLCSSHALAKSWWLIMGHALAISLNYKDRVGGNMADLSTHVAEYHAQDLA